MPACSGDSGAFTPQSGLVTTLDTGDFLPVVGFTNVVSGLVAVPAGLPAYSIAIMGDFVGANGAGASLVTWRLIDEFEGATTIIYSKLLVQAAGSAESFAIIAGLGNLAAGNHNIRLQVNSVEVPYTVLSAGLWINVYRQPTLTIAEE